MYLVIVLRHARPTEGGRRSAAPLRWTPGRVTNFAMSALRALRDRAPLPRSMQAAFIQGGRTINVTALDWSSTATFLLEAEVFHSAINSSMRESYPVVYGRTLNFTLPPTQEGVSIEAELDGHCNGLSTGTGTLSKLGNLQCTNECGSRKIDRVPMRTQAWIPILTRRAGNLTSLIYSGIELRKAGEAKRQRSYSSFLPFVPTTSLSPEFSSSPQFIHNEKGASSCLFEGRCIRGSQRRSFL